MTEARPTRQRLLDEGMRLFARNGFHATTVGDIEAAAGLQPRRGALYKHFPSKQGLPTKRFAATSIVPQPAPLRSAQWTSVQWRATTGT